MKYQNDKSKNLIFNKIFLNVHFLIPIAYKDFKFCLLTPHIHSEGKVPQIFNLGLSFYFMSKNGKHFLNVLRIDNGDFRLNSLVFTLLLIFPLLHDIFDILIHQIKAEILSYRMVSLV